jgi:hypothetical protein
MDIENYLHEPGSTIRKECNTGDTLEVTNKKVKNNFGRPKLSASEIDLRRLAIRRSFYAVTFLVRTMRDVNQPMDIRMKAANDIISWAMRGVRPGNKPQSPIMSNEALRAAAHQILGK